MRATAIVALNALLVGTAMAAAALVPKSAEVAVLVAPGSAPEEVVSLVARAGGRLIDSGGRDWVAVAAGEDEGFVGRLYAEGAMLVIDPAGLFGCISGE